MSEVEHKKRHIKLHRNFDELVADFVAQTGRLISETTIMDLMRWSHEQTIVPTGQCSGERAIKAPI